MKIKHKWIPILFLIFVTLWLRLVNLGYSDFQGDEIKAMWRPAPNQSLLAYLYTQRKGPVQFLVSYLVKIIDPSYSSEFLLRLPFTLVGILSIYFFYRLVNLHYGKKVALYATFLFSTNGFFIGLMRIAQYQPFVILFSILALYAFSLALQQERWRFKGIYLGVLFWVVSLFSHYDGIFFSPFAFYLLYHWYNQNSNLPTKARLKHLVIPFATSVMVLALYFVPFILSFPDSNLDYWMVRMKGSSLPGSEQSSSILIFNLYNPILAVYVYPILGLLSLARIKKVIPLVIWFAFPWLILEIAIFDPGTHIYTYLIPAIIMSALGLQILEEILAKLLGNLWGARLNLLWLGMLFGSLAGISHLIFVDHTPEYPFEKRRILLWTIGGPLDRYKVWSFGFPYYRRWEDIGTYITSMTGIRYYYSNEQSAIASYYVPYDNSVKFAGAYIYIHNPQSFKQREDKVKAIYWRSRYSPVKAFEYNGRVVAEVYDMPPGSLEDIKQMDY